MNTGIDGIDIIKHLVNASAPDQLHGCLARKSSQRFRAIPGIGNQSRSEARLDLVEDLDHFAQASLRLMRPHALLALYGVLTQPRRARYVLARGPKGVRNLARRKEAFIGILSESDDAPAFATNYDGTS